MASVFHAQSLTATTAAPLSWSTSYDASSSADGVLLPGSSSTNLEQSLSSLEYRKADTPARNTAFSASYSRTTLFHPHDAVSNRARPDGLMRSLTPPPGPLDQTAFSHTPSDIRANTVQLSGILLSPSISPDKSSPTPIASPASPLHEVHTPQGSLKIEPLNLRPPSGPSALSVLIAESRAGSRETSRSPTRNLSGGASDHDRTHVITTLLEQNAAREREHQQGQGGNSRRRPHIQGYVSGSIDRPPSESSPLLVSRVRRAEPVTSTPPSALSHFAASSKSGWIPALSLKRHISLPSPRAALQSLPAVILGLLLNILDGVSYGMIVFPASGVFADFGGTGVSMFFVTTIISQLVYSLGGSEFVGANGSMMIEVVPFFHILASTITDEIGPDDPQAIIATTIASFALSSILTGLVFFALGLLNLGVLIGFFPRHILVGCIGGVGIFLMETGFEITATMESETFSYTIKTVKTLFEIHNLVRWLPALALAIMLRIIMQRWHHQMVFPVYFLSIPVVFYIVVAIAHLDVSTLRTSGWLFDMGEVSEPWYHFYSYFDFRKTSFAALWVTIPTQFALLFFNVLHPPLNVPALAVSLDQDIDTNKELVAHGYSNFLAGITGSVPNYLVYVNTLLFYRVGGGTRFAGFLLAVFTAMLLLVGTAPIGFIPIMVVGALIFVLGMDLVKEAVWDTRNRVSRTEYITIVSIMVCMTLWDFVIGVLFGIVVSCVFFVVQNSQTRSIRALYTGGSVTSTVRRPSAQRAYIREVAKQTVIMRLQGHLFFGTITQVEARIRQLLDASSWQKSPIRFLIVDLSLVAGVDLSSAEAFVRVQRLLMGRGVIFVLCGFTLDSEVGKALENVDLFREDGVELFSYLNDALEWTENTYLNAWLSLRKVESGSHERAIAFPGQRTHSLRLSESMENSPRRSHLRDVGGRIFSLESSISRTDDLLHGEPFETMLKAFSSYGLLDPIVYRPLIPYFTRVTVAEGEVLWSQGEPSDALYIIQSGVLRASYHFAASSGIEESMIAGTIAGELSAVSGTSRNATVVVERDAVLWRLGSDDLQRLELEEPALARVFTKLILKSAKIDYDTLLAALAARQ